MAVPHKQMQVLEFLPTLLCWVFFLCLSEFSFSVEIPFSLNLVVYFFPNYNLKLNSFAYAALFFCKALSCS